MRAIFIWDTFLSYSMGKPVEDGTEQRGHGYGTCERDSVERFPWFHGTCSVYSATRENFVFHGTYPSRFPRKNAVPRNKISVFPPFLQLLTFSNFNFGNKKIAPSKLVPPFVSLLPWKKRDLSTDEKILTPASTEYPSGPISFTKKDGYFFILFNCITI